MVRVDRIELSTPAWKVGVLPLNYTRTEIINAIDSMQRVKGFVNFLVTFYSLYIKTY